MTKTISRRDFLKLGAASVGVLAVGQMLPPMAAKAAREGGQLNAAGDGILSTMCEMCVWRCGVLAKIKDGRVIKLDGNPASALTRESLSARAIWINEHV
jgi:thiosulfate reductase/polysulfide reductase chain A